MIDFFLRRPVFASVCSIVILLVGLVAIPMLPIAMYPNIAPPTVTVTATYTGASAEAVEASVTTPLEQQINSVQGLRYISSRSGSDGTSTITCTFSLERGLDQAANDVQNAVNLAQGQLPNEVKQTGVTVSKNSGTYVMAIGVASSDPRWDPIFMTNYLEVNVTNDLQRIPGVSQVTVWGERKWAMRLWIDPKKLADNGLTAGDVVTSLQAQNVQVAAGAIGAPPTTGNQPYEYGVQANGRLRDTTEFTNIVLRTNPDGGYVRVRDVGRVTLGAESYNGTLWFDGHNAVGLGILQYQTGNAVEVSKHVRATLDQMQMKFPAGMHYYVAFDSTEFVRESIREVVITLVVAIGLVVLVIFLFLQDWRTTLIPSITIPISLIGTFFLMQVLGFSINTLTLFGLTLATGLVVDDAIVVIENIARFIQDKGIRPLEAALEAMREIMGAVIASTLVLLAVFIPVATFPGTTGMLYKQFALTIACSMTISLFNALTLTPVLSARLLRKRPKEIGIFRPVNRAIDATRAGYHGLLPQILRFRFAVLGVFVGALLLTGWMYQHTPTAFIPDEDQGYALVTVQLPEGASLDQTHQVQRVVEGILRDQPEVSDIFDGGGYGFNGNGSNHAAMFFRLRPWGERKGADHSLFAVLQRVNARLAFLANAQAFALNPPAIPGLGFSGGFAFQLEDRGGGEIPSLQQAAKEIIAPANAPYSGMQHVYTTFRSDKPTIFAHVDRNKAMSAGVDLASLFQTMQVYLGSVYVNDFNKAGRTYRVYVQADAPYRARLNDLQTIYVRSAQTIANPNGSLAQAPPIPLSALISVHQLKAPEIITHFNLFRSIEIDGNTAAGYGTGQTIATMDRLAHQLPPAYDYEWSGITREEVEGGSQALMIFALGIVFVFLVLAAQYESFADPLVIMFAVPLALLGALGGLWIRHISSDVYAQVGFVMLIGLAAKNAILIVEFANQLRDQGHDAFEAVTRAAETRLRPILMTSIAFILGVAPLVFASGAGSAARHSLGTVVFAGMIFSTILNLAVTPVLYVVVASLEERFGMGRGRGATSSRDGRAAEPVIDAAHARG